MLFKDRSFKASKHQMLKKMGETLLLALAVAILWIFSDRADRSGAFADPVKTFYFWSGWLSFGALMLGLFAGKWGRFFGHCALIFALWHVIVFIHFDFDFDWGLMGQEILQKYYIDVGILAFLIMGVLGVFSLRGKFHRSLIWAVVICIVLSLVHIVMIQKVLGLAYWAVVIGTTGALLYKIIRKKLNRPFKP